MAWRRARHLTDSTRCTTIRTISGALSCDNFDSVLLVLFKWARVYECICSVGVCEAIQYPVLRRLW